MPDPNGYLLLQHIPTETLAFLASTTKACVKSQTTAPAEVSKFAAPHRFRHNLHTKSVRMKFLQVSVSMVTASCDEELYKHVCHSRTVTNTCVTELTNTYVACIR